MAGDIILVKHGKIPRNVAFGYILEKSSEFDWLSFYSRAPDDEDYSIFCRDSAKGCQCLEKEILLFCIEKGCGSDCIIDLNKGYM